MLACAVAGLLGAVLTRAKIEGFYAGLAKPGFTPPNWAFPVAWTVLYLLMAVSLWRVLSRPGERPGRRAAIIAYFVQLVLNAAWSWAFFAGHNPALGLAVILALDVALIATIRLFARIDRIAAWLLVPYLAWVLFATYLNAGVWWLNG